MIDEQNERAARVWRGACRAYGNAAAEVDALDNRGQVLAGEQAATAVIAREFEALEAENARLRGAVRRAEAVFTHYGELHAAKPDHVKAQRNFDLAEAMRAALGASHDADA